jgi:hypothetical protein
MQEQKYFISYAVYLDGGRTVFLNSIIYIDEEITSELIEKIQESLTERVNEACKNNPYYGAQIINIVKL